MEIIKDLKFENSVLKVVKQKASRRIVSIDLSEYLSFFELESIDDSPKEISNDWKRNYFLSFPDTYFSFIFLKERKTYTLQQTGIICGKDDLPQKLKKAYDFPLRCNIYPDGGICLGNSFRGSDLDSLVFEIINSFWSSKFVSFLEDYYEDDFEVAISFIRKIKKWEKKTKSDPKFIPKLFSYDRTNDLEERKENLDCFWGNSFQSF